MTARAPYRPGDHAHGLYYDPAYGTRSGAVTVATVTKTYDTGLPPWRVEYRVDGQPGQLHASYVDDIGEGDYLLPPAVVEKCRRSRTDLPDSKPCPGCVAAGAVDPDGPVYSLVEQVLTAAGAE